MTESPPPSMIDKAVEVARTGGCAKSRRGVVIYVTPPTNGFERAGGPRLIVSSVVGAGVNGPPRGFHCSGDMYCRAACNKVCVHAEDRALRAARGHGIDPGRLEGLHVKLDDDLELTPGGGPSCWQCSRTIADEGLGGFWLYEWSASRIAVVNPDGTWPPAPVPVWRRYTAVEFHAMTLRACDLPGGTS